jgi:hypothetical protein
MSGDMAADFAAMSHFFFHGPLSVVFKTTTLSGEAVGDDLT